MKSNLDIQSKPTAELRIVAGLSAGEYPREQIQFGVADPQAALERYGITVDALEEYRADKIPLLFVHGISDSPRCFSRMLAAVDIEKYQPWFLFYPSGLSLSLVGECLKSFLEQAQQKFAFSRLVVVAHSMGGLIARVCLNELAAASANERGFELPLFVSVSTPWAGHDAARVGVKLFYPKMRPSWTEIATGGPFVRSMFTKPLPEETEYALFFSYRRKRRIPFVISGLPLAGNHDGFVSLKSQLHPEAQQEARQVLGFEQDHRSILVSSELIEAFSGILARV